jgi:protein-L-isoaspartate(D-aspartate) O-methyltransferase
MVERQIAGRGIRDEAVLDAMRDVPREAFVELAHARSAYADAPLPIGEMQTISQPFIVALMAEAAKLRPGDRLLEVGTGSGYAAAVLARIAARVFTVERHPSLAAAARHRFRRLGYENIDVAVRDGTMGWPEHAPFDAIIVAAGSPRDVPPALLEQLAPGGRLIIPRGATPAGQDLVRIRRSDDGASWDEEHLEVVRFVPLVGQAGWPSTDAGSEPGTEPSTDDDGDRSTVPPRQPSVSPPTIPDAIAEACEPFDDIDAFDADDLLARIGPARLVLMRAGSVPDETAAGRARGWSGTYSAGAP